MNDKAKGLLEDDDDECICKESVPFSRWETKNGEYLLLSEMSKEHMKNCISHLKQKIKTSKMWIKSFKRQIKK